MEDVKRARNLDELSKEELADVLIRRPDWADAIFSVTDNIQELYQILQDKLISPEQLRHDWQLDHNRTVRQAMQSISGHLNNDPNYKVWEQVWDKYEEDLKSESKNRQSFRDTLEHCFSSGLSIEELKKICEEDGYKLEELYGSMSLKMAYAKYGYEYHEDSNSITRNEEARTNIETDEALEEFYLENPDMDDRPDSPIPEGMSIEEYSEAMETYINEFGEIIRPNNLVMSSLQQKETELASLKAEEKTISEVETLIKKQKEKEGQDIGE